MQIGTVMKKLVKGVILSCHEIKTVIPEKKKIQIFKVVHTYISFRGIKVIFQQFLFFLPLIILLEGQDAILRSVNDIIQCFVHKFQHQTSIKTNKFILKQILAINGSYS